MNPSYVMSPFKSLLPIFNKRFTFDPLRQRRHIGIECEFPVVYRNGNAVSYAVIRELFQHLREHGFFLEHDPLTGEVISAKRPARHPTGKSAYTWDVISTDTGYSVIEISPAPAADLFTLQKVLDELLALLTAYCQPLGAMLLGYGVHPLSQPSSQMLANKSRYLLFKKWSDHRLIDRSQGHDCDLLTITASNQTHVDVAQDEAITAVNVLNGLSGLQIILNANSPIWGGQVDILSKAVRESFWPHCFPGRTEQIGIPKQFTDMADYLEFLCAFKRQSVERNKQSIFLDGTENFLAFMHCDQAMGKTVDGRRCTVKPAPEDIYSQAAYAWFNGRLAPLYGTVEARVCCQQPPGETLCSHALILGLVENLSAAERLLQRHSWVEWQELKLSALQHTFNARVLHSSVMPLLDEMLEIAAQGLQRRKLGEEDLLAPLFERLHARQSPADRAIDLLHEQGMKGMLDTLAITTAQRQQCDGFTEKRSMLC